MEIKFDKLAIFVNRQKKNEITNEMLQMKKITGSDYLISFPEDEEIGSIAEKGESLFNLSEKNEIVLKIDDFIKELI
jgi:CO dehydrogenase nickel-insertion accessory protein CooC1